MRFINNLKFGILCLVALRALGHPVVQAPSPTGTLDATLGSVDTPKNVFVACDPTDAVCNDVVNGDFMHGVNEVDGHVGTQEGYLSNAAGKVVAIEGAPDQGTEIHNDGQTIDYDLQGTPTAPGDRRELSAHADVHPSASVGANVALKPSVVMLSSVSSLPTLPDAYEAVDPSSPGRSIAPSALSALSVSSPSSVSPPSPSDIFPPSPSAISPSTSDITPPVGLPQASPPQGVTAPINSDAKQLLAQAYPESEFETGGSEVQNQGEAAQAVGDGVDEFGNEADAQFNRIATGEQYHGDDFVDAVVPA